MPVEEFNRTVAKKAYHKAFDDYRMGLTHSIPFFGLYAFAEDYQKDWYVLTNLKNIHRLFRTRKEAEQVVENEK